MLCGALLAFGLASCSNDSDLDPVPVPEEGSQEQPTVVEHAYVSMDVDGGDQTRAAYDGRYLNWAVGDKLIAFSNGKINGTLTCTAVGGGSATFSGEMENFTPAGVNLFFLGNRTVADDATSLTVDFSSQDGSKDGLVNYIFLKNTGDAGVTFTETSEGSGVYNTTDVAFQSLVSIARLVLDQTGTPGADGYKAKQAKIFGLKDQMTINFADGSVTAAYVNDDHVTDVIPSSAANYSLEYYMAVIPDESYTALTMNVYYQSEEAGSTIVNFDGINWSSMAAGKSYKWAGKNNEPEYNSSKGGYNGGSVEGDRADGTSTKGGYNGGSVEGDREDGSSTKTGYSGGSL